MPVASRGANSRSLSRSPGLRPVNATAHPKAGLRGTHPTGWAQILSLQIDIQFNYAIHWKRSEHFNVASVQANIRHRSARVNGCYVEMFAPLPVDSVVELDIDLEGKDLRPTGRVRSSQTSFGMGRRVHRSEPRRPREAARIRASRRDRH